MASSPRWAAAEEKRSVCLDTLGSDQRELVVAVGESKKVGEKLPELWLPRDKH